MDRKYLAFDIETAKDIPGSDFNWKPHRPLGITCIASQSTDSAESRIWFTLDESGTPAPQMSRTDVTRFIQFLVDSVSAGYVLLSWNGLGFDLDVLAEESGLIEDCRKLAKAHVDMMFHIVCAKGFPVALKNAAAGLGVPGKLAGVEGIAAPALWAAGKFDLVKEYVSQDVRTTLAVALAAEQRKSFAWTTRKGTIGEMPLRTGWLPVERALKLPLPDLSWMPSPPSRSDFTNWLDASDQD